MVRVENHVTGEIGETSNLISVFFRQSFFFLRHIKVNCVRQAVLNWESVGSSRERTCCRKKMGKKNLGFKKIFLWKLHIYLSQNHRSPKR